MGRLPKKDRELLDASKQPLLPTEQAFIAKLVDKEGKGYLNATAAYKEAFPWVAYNTAMVNSSKMMHRPRVAQSVKEALEAVGIKDKIRKGLVKIVDGFNEGEAKYRAKDMIAVADLTFKVCGDYAPEKHLNVNLTPEERDRAYEDILVKIREAQAKRTG